MYVSTPTKILEDCSGKKFTVIIVSITLKGYNMLHNTHNKNWNVDF